MITNEEGVFAVAYNDAQGSRVKVQRGLAKHELFAAMALQGLLANPGIVSSSEALNENLQSELVEKATDIAKKFSEKLNVINEEIEEK